MSYAGKIKINNTDYPIASTLYKECTTAAETTPKIVSFADFDTLLEGVMIAVKFEETNTATNPQLQVGSTAAKNIYADGTNTPIGTTPSTSWPAKSVVLFMYDGSAWRIVNTTKALRTEMLTEFTNTGNRISNSFTKLAPAYSSNNIYSTGALVSYGDGVYRCTTAIAIGEEWTPAHWAAVTATAASKPRVGTITMSTSWSGSNPWYQTVTVSGTSVFSNSVVSLQPDYTAFNQMVANGTAAIYISNNNGTLTAYAILNKPTAALTVQCLVSETV